MSVGVQSSFNRLVVLTVYGRERRIDEATGSIVLENTDLVGREFRSRLGDGSPGFRIKFTVERPTGSIPQGNIAQIEIYNVGELSRNYLSDTKNVVELKAGYGDNAAVIFRGNISFARTQKIGPDYVTTINACDGLAALQGSNIDKSFGAGVSLNSLINTLVGSMKGTGITPGTIQGVPNQVYNQGIVLSGNAVRQLKEVCEKHNLQFSIQDEKVTILPYGSNNGVPAIVLSPDTGLIGIPEIRGAGLASPLLNTGAPKPTEQLVRETSIIAFKALLNPQIVLNQLVLISSKFVNGTYTVVKVVHRGDSWGGEFFTEGEAT